MNIENLSRREFLQSSALLSAGLMVGCSGAGMMPLTGEPGNGQISAWLHIAEDGTVTYQVPSSEMGQGALTGLTMIVAEELDADWGKMNTQFAPLNSEFNNPMWMSQNTGGSGSVMGFWEPMRQLGATARLMLVMAAAQVLNASPDEFTTQNGEVIHRNGQRLQYGELVGVASGLKPPKEKEVSLKTPDQFKIIGQPKGRLDTPDKVQGKTGYGIDVQIPNMHVATLVLSPTIGGDVESYDAQAALAVPGVKAVVQIPKDITAEQQAAGVAVVADSYATALKASRLLSVKWNPGEFADLSTESIRKDMHDTLDDLKTPDLSGFEKSFEVEYETPYLSHSPLEPMNATARVSESLCEVWAPCQNQTIAGKFAKKVTGLDKDQIQVNTTYLGGGFGRRLEADYVAYAVFVAKQTGLPVKLIWSREQDTKHGFYRPASIVRFQVGLDGDGHPAVWNGQLTVPAFLGRFMGQIIPATKILPIDSLLKSANAMGMSQGFMDPSPFPYWVDDFDMKVKLSKSPVPTGNHRAVAHSYTGFYAESAIDEAAHLAGEDPYQYRKTLLEKIDEKDKDEKHQRLVNVMDQVAEKAGWGRQPRGRAQGMAIAHANGSFVGYVAEVSVSDSKQVTVHKVTAVVDCGIAVNPDTVRAQFEGGVFWGMAAVFTEEITISNGQVDQSNFYDYRTLYTRHMPEVEVHIVNSAQAPTGVGEPPIPPLPPAITNAIFAATGERLRRLPISHSGYTI